MYARFYGGQDGRQHEQRIAPAMRIDQGLRQRQEDEAGECCDQCHRRHRTPPLTRVREVLRDDREGRLVEHG